MRKLILIGVLFVAGCALWTQIGGLYTSDSGKFSVELPSGWMKYNAVDYLLITRDGVLLQNIAIERIDIKKELSHTKKKLRQDMLPQEAAEVIIDNMASNPAILNLEVIENMPAKVGGFPGFKLVTIYKNKDGLKFKSVYYGFLWDHWLYSLRYSAPQRYYFAKDVTTFENVVKSFKLLMAK